MAENNQDEQQCDPSNRSDSGWRDSAAGVEPHVKGEISGNEDLYIDGTVRGLVQLDERKVTIGTTAKLTADIIAGE